MNIIRKSRGTELPKQGQRIFLNYSGCNVAERDDVISDLLSVDAGLDCVVSYIENPDAATIEEEELRNELYETQLVVIRLTLEMLVSATTENLPLEYRIARELHIPVLPILSDKELF